MSNAKKTIVEWFGYTRRERRGTIVLLIIIFLVLALKPIATRKYPEVEMTTILAEAKGQDETIPIAHDSAVEKKTQRRIPPKQQIVELNSCDSAALDALPGIGTVLSSRIIRYRNLLGGFYDVSQLKEVYGLTEETYELIVGKVEVDASNITKVPINEAEYRTLLRMPYLEKEDVDNIMRYKKIVGEMHSMDELIDDEVISESTAHKVAPYLDFGR